MNRDPRQQAYLHAMGIDVWVRRDAEPAVADDPTSEVPVSTNPTIEAEAFRDTPLAYPEVPNVKSLNWPDLEQQVVSCQLCELHATRTQAVFGVGNQQADWLIIGEAPGAEEDRQGEPFVGRAGQLLNEMLKAIGLQREQVYIANVLKCRPPNNRDPEPEEVETCKPFLLQQIQLIKPKLVCSLGNFATQTLLGKKVGITKVRGRTFPLPEFVLFPMLHPAAALHKVDLQAPLREDFKKLKTVLDTMSKPETKSTIPSSPAPSQAQPEESTQSIQLNLFGS